MRVEFSERFNGSFRNFQETASECAGVPEALEQNYVVDGEGKKRVRFGRKESDAIFDGCVYDSVTVELERNRLVVSFEEILVDAIVVIK